LEVFNQLKTEQDVIRIKQKVSSAGGRVSQAQVTQMSNGLRRVGDFRTALNKRAVQLYGKPSDQLEEGLVDQLMNQISTEEHYSFSFERPDASARVDQTNACSEASFLLSSTRVSDGRTGYASWTSRRSPAPPIATMNMPSRATLSILILNTGLPASCATASTTGLRAAMDESYPLLFGNRSFWLWIGYPGLLSITMRYSLL
jgi:hypothetical protein